MNRTVGIIVLLVLSLAIGAVLGELNFRFFQRVIPPVAMGQVSMGWVRTTCLVYGLGVGLLLFIWGLLASSVARLFGRRSPRST